jgi:uncharacterized Zn finger protein
MIIENQAVGDDCAHKVEILCPNCSRDVDETELIAQKCNDCGHDLSQPKQSVQIHATSVAAIAITF